MQRVLGGAGRRRAVDDAAKAAYDTALTRRTSEAETAYADSARALRGGGGGGARRLRERAAASTPRSSTTCASRWSRRRRSCAAATSEVLQKYSELCAVERQQVVDAGGLFILGTERHESRRIDNQLRGRAGRQGDPGASRFFLSLEDDLLRIFGAERIQGLMTRLGMEEGEPIEHRLITRAIANAQSKVEAHNFDVRKHLLEYDDVMNKQREVIYDQRREVLGGETLDRAGAGDDRRRRSTAIVEQYAPGDTPARRVGLGGARRGDPQASSTSACRCPRRSASA